MVRHSAHIKFDIFNCLNKNYVNHQCWLLLRRALSTLNWRDTQSGVLPINHQNQHAVSTVDPQPASRGQSCISKVGLLPAPSIDSSKWDNAPPPQRQCHCPKAEPEHHISSQ